MDPNAAPGERLGAILAVTPSPWSAVTATGLAAAGVAALAGAIVLVDRLSAQSLLEWRTPVLTALAVVVHLFYRSRSSLLVGALHLAAIESCITDLMATGSWAMGWGPLTKLTSLAMVNVAAIGASTAFAIARRPEHLRLLKRLAPLAIFSGVAGTALGREVVPPIAWAFIGTGFAYAALVWALDLRAVVIDRGAVAIAWPVRIDWVLAAWVFAAAGTISILVFAGMPHVPDETAYWFQAKYFASGRLWLPSPPDQEAFALLHTLDDNGRWFSIFPPGWPAVLAIGFFAGAPTWVNPLLAAATVVALFRLLRRLYGHDVASVACLLLALSPEFLLMSAGLMSHPLSVLCTVAAAYSMHRADSEHPAPWAALGGIALGLLALTRLFEAALIVTAFALYFVTQRCWRSRRRMIAIAVFYGVSLWGPATIGAYQHALTGGALDDPITKYFDRHYYPRSNRLGFGASIANLGWSNDVLPGHSPLEASIHVQLNTQLVNTELFGWAFGSLAGVLLYVAWRKRLWEPADGLFVSLLALPIAGHFFYWYSGADYGARYWYQIVVPCVVLTARAISSPSGAPNALVRVAAIASIAGVLVFVPWRAATKYDDYRGVGDSVLRLTRRCDLRGGLVLVRGAVGEVQAPRYATAAFLNEPGFGGDAPVFAREVSADITERMRSAWPDRPVWVIEVPDEKGGDVRIVQQPPGTSTCVPSDRPDGAVSRADHQ